MKTWNFAIDYGIVPQLQSYAPKNNIVTSSLFSPTPTEQKIQQMVEQDNAQFTQPKKYSQQEFFTVLDQQKNNWEFWWDAFKIYAENLQFFQKQWWEIEGIDINQELAEIEKQIQNKTQEQIQPGQEEILPWFDVWVKVSEWVANLWKNLKFEAGNSLIDSKNPFVSSFWNMLEGFKFAANIPWDAIQLVWELWQAISNPIWTAKSLKTLWEATVETWLNKLFGTDVYTSEDKRKMIEGVTQALEDNFWSLEAVKKTIIENPTDVLLTIQWWLQIAKTWIKNPNALATIDMVDEAINPINILKTEWALIYKPIKNTTNFITKEVPSAILGKTTWAWQEAIKTAFQNGGKESFAKALRWEITDQDILNSAQKWLEIIKEQRSELYGKNYEKLIQNKSQLWMKEIEDALIKNLDDAKVKIVPKENWFDLDFSNSTITQKTSQSQIREMFDDIVYWSDDTPEGLDILKQRVQDRWIWWEWSWKSDRLSTNISNSIKSKIINEVPEYKEMVKNYEVITNELKEIQKVLSIWNEKSKMTAITRLWQTLKDNLSMRREVVEKLEELAWIDLKSSIAWSTLKDVMPKWIAWVVWGWAIWYGMSSTLLNPALITGVLLSSPRLIWELARVFWVSKNILQNWFENAKKIFDSVWWVKKN